jgi:ABC-type phosphate transport system substrate-binding protein
MIGTLTISSRALMLAALLAAGIPVPQAQSSYKLIVNNGIRIDSLSKKAVSDIFLKRTTKWDGGSAVVPVDQADTTSVRADFSREVHGKSTAAIKSFWNQQIFSGRDVPPVEKKSDADVVSFVRSTSGAVGYVSAGAAVEGVRVVDVR